MNQSSQGLSLDQLENGTPANKKLELRSYYKDAVMHISPAKDINGRYLGIDTGIPESKRLEMGYVPSIESRLRIYDGMVYDLNNSEQRKDWEWLKHCVEIAPDFETGQGIKSALFYVYRAGVASSKKVALERKKVYVMNLILTDSPENLYNRVKILGVNMDAEAVTDVQEYLLELLKTDLPKVKNVYESKMFALDLLYLNAIEKGTIRKEGGVIVFGDILLGVDKGSVINYFQNPANSVTVTNIESMTYGRNKLSGEQVNTALEDDFEEEYQKEQLAKQDKQRQARIDNLAKAREAKAKKEAAAKK